MSEPQPTPTFEELQRELEAIVARLERGDVPLDEAIELWRRGEEIHRACLARLDAAQGRIEELSAGGAPEPPDPGEPAGGGQTPKAPGRPATARCGSLPP